MAQNFLIDQTLQGIHQVAQFQDQVEAGTRRWFEQNQQARQQLLTAWQAGAEQAKRANRQWLETTEKLFQTGSQNR
jgi:hypothetical protein